MSSPPPKSHLDLRSFNAGLAWSEQLRYVAWGVVQAILFQPVLTPRRLRPWLLRGFGAKVGRRCVIRDHVTIHAPWNLELGDDVWIGRGVDFINHAPIRVGHDVCISQNVMLCSSGHDFTRSDFRYRHAAIEVGACSWLTVRATILPGAKLPDGSLVRPGSVVR